MRFSSVPTSVLNGDFVDSKADIEPLDLILRCPDVPSGFSRWCAVNIPHTTSNHDADMDKA